MRPYPLEEIIYHGVQHHTALNPPNIHLPDNNFQPRGYYHGKAPGWTKPKSQPSRRWKHRAEPTEEDEDDSGTEIQELASEIDAPDEFEDEEEPFFVSGLSPHDDLPGFFGEGDFVPEVAWHEDDEELEEGEVLEGEEEVQKTTGTKGQHSPPHPGATSPANQPVAQANFARGARTCYNSSALQALHNIPTFASVINGIETSDTRNTEVLVADPNLQLHDQFLASLKVCFQELDRCALTREKVGVDYVQGFRISCYDLIKLSRSKDRWLDDDSDSVDFYSSSSKS